MKIDHGSFWLKWEWGLRSPLSEPERWGFLVFSPRWRLGVWRSSTLSERYQWRSLTIQVGPLKVRFWKRGAERSSEPATRAEGEDHARR